MNSFFSTSKKILYFFLTLTATVLLLLLFFCFTRIRSLENTYSTYFSKIDPSNRELISEVLDVKNAIVILIFITLFFLVFGIFFLHKTVFTPIDYVISALQRRSIKSVKILKTLPGEFGVIGNLLQEEYNSSYTLIQAKRKAEENDRLKSTFLENLTHEIRTPMNAIVGFSDLIITSKLDNNQKNEYIKIINKSGKNLISIIDDLIEISRIESNQIVSNYSAINLDNCLKELYETIRINLPEDKKLDFYITENTNQKLIKDIKVDVVKLRQVIINLINNAIKYTDHGYVTFGYEIESRDDCEFIKIFIKDSGVGISPEYHNFIFERFQRIENDKAIQVGGLGLGLAISKAYAEIMGGYITVSSNIPGGTLFTVYVPLKFDNEFIDIIAEPAVQLSGKKCTKSILVAEDDNINFMLIEKMLQPSGCAIIRAENGAIAVKICQENDAIHLVLMDIKMPVMNGYEAFEIIKKIKPDLPVIAQTAYASIEDKEKIDQLGFTSYISKPINKTKLLEEINKII